MNPTVEKMTCMTSTGIQLIEVHALEKWSQNVSIFWTGHIHPNSNECKEIIFKLWCKDKPISPSLKKYSKPDLKPSTKFSNNECWNLIPEKKNEVSQLIIFHIKWCFYQWLNTRSWAACFFCLKRLIRKYFVKAWNGKRHSYRSNVILR